MKVREDELVALSSLSELSGMGVGVRPGPASSSETLLYYCSPMMTGRGAGAGTFGVSLGAEEYPLKFLKESSKFGLPGLPLQCLYTG